ncbi:disks large-associated protein 4-like [Macrobrachium nipponense]|uniref:disks large-associated protein 4-like n=1 Tax=Macrobrachium nipponense TaxID=159736 RepID=UPI0030C7E853
MKEAMKTKQAQPEDVNDLEDGVEILVAEGKKDHLKENLTAEKDNEKTKSDEDVAVNDKTEVENQKEGHHFLQIVEREVSRLQELINNAEYDLETFRQQMSEEVQGKVLAATGKGRLLISQKIEQFRGLCQQNIDGPKGEEPAIIAADLAGFWDMVSIQVGNVYQLFEEIGDLKSHGWKHELDTCATTNVPKGPAKRKPVQVKKGPSKPCTEKTKARDEARKKLLEERRRAMKEAMKTKQAQPEDVNGGIDCEEILMAEGKKDHLQDIGR